MITDAIALSEIQACWKGVEDLRAKIQRRILGAFASGGAGLTFAADVAHNLPFVHACAVLNDVLEQLAKEGHFKCKDRRLGVLIAASKTKLPWNNLVLVEEAVAKRNDIAHHATILPRGDCWRYTDTIKRELLSWGVV